MPIPFQASFSAGEIDPSLYARVDLAKYRIGLKTVKNFICHVQGKASNRPGTKFIAEVKDSARARLIPFQFSTTQSYALEFGNNTMRVFKDGAIVTESDVTISGATQANPVVIDATAHGYSNGDWIIISEVVGMTELNGKTFKVANKTDDDFELNNVDGVGIDGSGFATYVSGGVCNLIYEIATPYASTDLVDLAYAQSADIMYITHPNHYPRKLSRTDHTSWTIEIFPFKDGPYSPRVSGDDDIVITPGARSGNNVAITASSSLFVSAMVGGPFRIGYVNPNDIEEISWGWGTIDQVTDGLNARIDIETDSPFGFEFVDNPDFGAGIGFWSDLSTLLSLFTYDAVNTSAVLTKEATGKSDMRQEIAPTPNVVATLTVDMQQEPTVLLGNDPIDTVDTSTTVTVNDTGHGLVTGNNIILAGVPGAVNGIPAIELNTTHVITYVDDDSYTITVTTPATSTGSGGGAVATHQRPFGTVRVLVGKTSGSADVLSAQTETTPGVKTYTVTPTQFENYITIDNTGSASGNRALINETSFIRQDLSSSFWRQPAWTSANGYPRAVTFFEQRLFFAGTSSEPQTFWSSKTSDFENFGFTTPSIASDGLQYTMDSRQFNAIQWLTSSGFMVAGTSRAEWKMFSGSNSDAMTPSSIYAKEETFYGSSSPGLLPPTIGNSLLFVQRGSKAVRDLQFSLDVDRLAGRDISIFSAHLLDGFSITEWAYADLPDSVLWSVRNDGTLLGFTYLREQEVAAWHRHVTNGSFESVAVVSSVSTDETYFIVNRSINGITRRYVEQLQERITDEATYDYFFVDSGLTYSGDPATIMSGLDHLEGKDVSVLADGEVVEGKTVSGGQITLTNPATLVHVGLPYVCDLESLNIETGGQEGATQGKKKIVGETTIHFLKTRGAFVGTNSGDLSEVGFSDEGDGENPPALFTGKKEIRFKDTYRKEKRVFIRQTAPLPITVLSIIPEIENSE